MSHPQLAVVTGASSGIGYALAAEFAKNGFDLVVAAEEAEIHEAAGALRDLGAEVTPVQTDLAVYDGVEDLYEQIEALGRPVDAAALNAGVGVNGAFHETDLDDELNLIGLNVTSVVHLAKRLLPGMVARGQGRLLITSSIAATAPAPFHATYNASKAFVQSLAEAIRYELKDTGVTVTALMPGVTDTPFFDRSEMRDTRIGATSLKDDPDEVAREAFEALLAGKDKVITGGLKNRLTAAAANVLPQPVSAAIQAKLTRPGSAE
jgi:short-subunit dehydrogenase